VLTIVRLRDAFDDSRPVGDGETVDVLLDIAAELLGEVLQDGRYPTAVLGEWLRGPGDQGATNVGLVQIGIHAEGLISTAAKPTECVPTSIPT